MEVQILPLTSARRRRIKYKLVMYLERVREITFNYFQQVVTHSERRRVEQLLGRSQDRSD